MPLLGFTTSPDKIRAGEKVITVRKRAKDRRWEKLQLGDPLFLYWKLRTPECEPFFDPPARPCAYKAGPIIPEDFTKSLARRDGFVSLNEMLEWFQKTHRQYLHEGPGEFFVIGWLHPDPTVRPFWPVLPHMHYWGENTLDYFFANAKLEAK